MIHYRFCVSKSPEFECDVCEQLIDEREVVLLRAASALPEERTYHVHPHCVAAFERGHPDEWRLIRCDSMEAGWLM
ncbi:MAG: hypothetical protein SH809_18370 [Rhodothermales bacterium]|nr:hypothetical protein [Rhodothermales bacterium]